VAQLLSFVNVILSLKEANKFGTFSVILIRWNLKKGGFSVDANRLFFVYKSLLLKVELEGHDFGIMA